MQLKKLLLDEVADCWWCRDSA